jgi:hypothetical protein
MFRIEKEYIPGIPTIWVVQLNDDDPILVYSSIEEASAMLEELKLNDKEGRDYRIVEIVS